MYLDLMTNPELGVPVLDCLEHGGEEMEGTTEDTEGVRGLICVISV